VKALNLPPTKPPISRGEGKLVQGTRRRNLKR